jgi:hypothetical protein
MDGLRKLEAAVGRSGEDTGRLLAAADIIVPRAEDMVDCWRAAIASPPSLLQSSLDAWGNPDEDYKAAAKPQRENDGMPDAWTRAVLLNIALWCRPDSTSGTW